VSAWIAALVLSTALFHAGWNAVLRHGNDRLWTSAMIAFGDSTVAALLLPFLPWPSSASLPFMFASFVLHTAYRVLLIFAYQWDLGTVYPISRGSAPLLVTAAAALFAGEHVSGLALVAIALISLGIVALSQSHLVTAPPRALIIAVTTGVVIASYSMVDGMGARLAGNSFSYVFWLEATEFLPWPFILLARRGTLRGDRAAPGDGWRAVGAGAVSVLAYALVVWAMTRGALGIVTALRETSVVFAALLGWLFLGERLTWRRLFACGAIAAGIIMLAIAAAPDGARLGAMVVPDRLGEALSPYGTSVRKPMTAHFGPAAGVAAPAHLGRAESPSSDCEVAFGAWQVGKRALRQLVRR
jgi:drug/metabolite transporter (DMT)-like permease